MDHSKQLGEGGISQLLLKFSIPGIVGMVANALYNVVDRIFVGRVAGSEGIAALTVSFPAMLILMAFGMLVGMGANALISMQLGAGRKDEAELVLGNALVLLILKSILLSVAGVMFINRFLSIFGASEQILPYARSYLIIILMGTVFQAIGFGMNNFIRGEGNPRMAMLTMLIGAALNVIFDAIFIFVFDLGIQGAAFATVTAQAISAAWVLHYFLSGGSTLKLKLKNLKVRWSIVAKIIVIGSPPFAMQIAASVLNAVLNNQLLKYGGDLAISVMGIVFSLMMIILMPVFGITQGAQPIIGYNYGAEQFDRVKSALQLASLAATLITIIGFIMTRIYPEQLIRLFSKNDPALVAMGTHAMGIFLMMLPIVGFQIVSANYFQAVGKARQSMFLILSRQVLLLIPALIVLPHFWGLDGIWFAGPIADLGSSILTGIWLFFELRSLDLKQKANHSRAKVPVTVL